MHKISFTYNKKSDVICWKRYNDFIKDHGDVWGIKKEIKQIFKLKTVNFEADVSEIIEKYQNVFKIPKIEIEGFVVTTPFSMINDGGIISENGIVYYSFFTPNPSVVLAHEIFHIYFEKYTKRRIKNYDEVKEYFTVILNDLFGSEVSRGYPKHQEFRKKIYDCWINTKSIDECIKIFSN